MPGGALEDSITTGVLGPIGIKVAVSEPVLPGKCTKVCAASDGKDVVAVD